MFPHPKHYVSASVTSTFPDTSTSNLLAAPIQPSPHILLRPFLPAHITPSSKTHTTPAAPRLPPPIIARGSPWAPLGRPLHALFYPFLPYLSRARRLLRGQRRRQADRRMRLSPHLTPLSLRAHAAPRAAARRRCRVDRHMQLAWRRAAGADALKARRAAPSGGPAAAAPSARVADYDGTAVDDGDVDPERHRAGGAPGNLLCMDLLLVLARAGGA
eukprot:270133-Chlamydomonas_euryale.AAC.1